MNTHNNELITAKGINTLNKLRDYIKSCFSGLIFDEASHTYKYDNRFLISTSKYISRFYKEFNTYVVAESKAKSVAKHASDKRTGDYYRRRWAYLRDEAANRGSRIHLYAECYPDFDEPSCDGERGVREFYNWIESVGLSVLMLELKMFDKEYYKAGTTDGLLFDKDSKDVIMFDFKTNTSNLLKYDGKLLEPFKKYRHSKLSMYTLQAADYTYMFTKGTGLTVSKRYVVWLNNNQHTDPEDDHVEVYRGQYVRVFEVPDWSSIIAKELRTKGLEMPKKSYSIKSKIKKAIKPVNLNRKNDKRNDS